ncbi:hypothetical protein [Williamsia deligens]|uniref:Uncharacterized protein n=1 Tax=Williamsia deligens TaxID=321325 RepID=A0ABW3G5S1_9NOCA|nr:hypothetical protein [Williamsia deligens]
MIRTTLSRDDLRAGVAKAAAPLDVVRLVVVGGPDAHDALLAGVLSRLLVAERLDLEVAYVAPFATPATTVYGLPHGDAAATLAVAGEARSVPLIRDDAAVVVVGEASHRGVGSTFTGETYVDSTLLFSGETREVRIRPTAHEPGVEGAVARRFRTRWVPGRAVQTGGIDVVVERDGVRAPRPVPRSTVYRHADDWKLVRP